jgi:hypothetical protein
MVSAGLLEPCFKDLQVGWEKEKMLDSGKEKKKKIPIYILEFRTGSKGRREEILEDEITVTESEDGGIGKEKDKRKKIRCRYSYTAIFPQPSGAKGRILGIEEAKRKGKYLNQEANRAEIGIASFHDTHKEIRDREEITNKYLHKVSIKTGRVGRPMKRKRTQKDV